MMLPGCDIGLLVGSDESVLHAAKPAQMVSRIVVRVIVSPVRTNVEMRGLLLRFAAELVNATALSPDGVPTVSTL
jgi:hypothetical protein